MCDYTIRPCFPKDLQKILDLQEEAFSLMQDSTMLRRNSVDMLKSCLLPPHITLGAWQGEILAGFSVLYQPQDIEEDLSHLLEGVAPIPMEKTANNKLCIVRSNCRGRRLQYRLGLAVEQEAINRGLELLCVTVAPNNIASLMNIERQGYKYNRTLTKYGGVRMLYWKKIG